MEMAEVRIWRCGAPACRERPVLGAYTEMGGVYVRVVSRGRVHRYTHDLKKSPLDAQCPSCGRWRRLTYERDTITEGPRPGFIPRPD